MYGQVFDQYLTIIICGDSEPLRRVRRSTAETADGGRPRRTPLERSLFDQDKTGKYSAVFGNRGQVVETAALEHNYYGQTFDHYNHGQVIKHLPTIITGTRPKL